MASTHLLSYSRLYKKVLGGIAVAMLANTDAGLRAQLDAYRARQTATAVAMSAELT